jgi:ribosomal protein S21
MSVNVRVELRPGARQDVQGLLRRFRRACNEAGVIHDYRSHEFYEKPCEKRNRAKRQAKLVRLYAEQGKPEKPKAKKREGR